MPWWQCFECMTHRDVDDVRCLDFSHRLLHDVPADVFAYERTLEELHLNANRIADLPRQLFYCQELRVLNLNDNELVALPPAISSLTSLQRLSLSKNALNGIVENIKGCKHLQMLDISLNGFQKLPEPVTSVVSLQELYLNDTSLEALPANFGRLVNLRILEMRDNMLNTLPKSMARLQQLQRLDIGSNEFTELPEVIGQLVNLTELWLDGNRVRRISANVGNLTKLVHFEASNNLLTHLPNEVANWSRLQELSISVNDFKQLPFSIGMMKALVTLKADENNLQELPDSISQLENLEEIMVSHNDLFRLPASIGLLRKLRFLTADENLLRALPSELCSCTALTILSVRGNKLTEVPVDIGHLRNLKVFSIVNNFVTHLPVSVLNLQQLSALWISDNQSQPLMPLQKDFGPEQSVRLTCFMLPQTAGGGGGGGGKQNGLMHDKERLDTLRLHLTAKQMADYDENAPIMSSPPPGQAHGHGDDPTGASSASGGPSKRRICFASDPVSATNDAAARLMRSPTPYPKELRILAKYARYVHTNGQTEYVHVDDLRAAGGEPIGVGDTTDGIELLEQQRQLEQHHQQQQQHYQQQQQVPSPPINGQQHQQHHMQEHPNQDGSDHDSGTIASASAIIPHIDDTSASASLRYDEVNRYAPPTHLPPNFQPTLSPLLGDDELDARAAYFYATAEQKITTPVPQILDYENVSACSSSLRPSLLGAPGTQSHQPIYGTAPVQNGIGQATAAERPASEVRMSQASSFNDAGSLSSAFGMTAALNGTRSPAILGQQQHPQQYYPPMNGAGGMAVAQLDEDVVYYSTSQGSESNYGQLPANNWQQQQQQQHLPQHHQQLATAAVASQPIYGMSPHLNHSDRVSLASDYARSELSSVVSGLMTPQQQQQQPLLRQPPPYHIARAYTKKSKSDLMHYEQFRHTGSLNGDAAESPTLSNGHGPFYASEQPEKDSGSPPQQQQFYSNGSGIYANSDGQLEAVQYQQQQQHQQQLHQQTESIYVSRSTPNRTQPLQHPMHSPPQATAPAIVANGGGMVDSNRNPEQNGGGPDGGEVGAASALPSPTNSAAGANGVASPPPSSVLNAANNSKSPWLFGQHKNPKVMQLSVPKTIDIGFQLTQPPAGNGIFVGEVDANSIVNTLLRRHDKILDMDGVDFTGIALADALTVLSNAGAVINVMVSRI